MKTDEHRSLHDEARAYYALCAEADALGIPTSLDDPDSPPTVAALQQAALAAAREQAAATARERLR